ncbi:pyrokinin-1 receptor-like [Ornithodoros turicata]|uniref:pyrokinin-1 receptor-like n=1 Tax=Ornithodoros turicata TaxID=34597 RepID=UPI00313A1F9B
MERENGYNSSVPHQHFSTNHTPQYLPDTSEPLTTVVTMTIVYALILVTGVTGNVCTCIVIARNRYMHTATNFYLFSLAISDLLLLLLGLPQETYQLWRKYPYVFGEAFCIIRGMTSEMSTNASILTITAFTVERYVAICHPLKAHTMSQLPRAIRSIVGIWIVAGTFALPLALQFGIVYEAGENGVPIPETAECMLKHPVEHAFTVSTVLFFVLPISVISVLYVLIGIQLRRSSAPRDRSPEINGSARGNKGSLRYTGGGSKRAVVKMLVAVVVSFFICWTPFHAQRLIATYAEQTATMQLIFTILTYISGVTYYLSATMNPILYQVMSVKFRQAFADTFGHCWVGASRRQKATLDITFTSFYNHHNSSSLCSSSSRMNRRKSISTQNLAQPKLDAEGNGKRASFRCRRLSASCTDICIEGLANEQPHQEQNLCSVNPNSAEL